tara:strand:+ start:621 stop:1742 length:1122 start_codon:yes stop_codon:yes gene_type:complete
MLSKIKLIDLFSGVGGLSYGFSKDSNFEIVAANEILPNMAKSYSLNHPNVKMYCCDIKDLSFKKIKNDLKLNDGDIDLIIGGPPCQAFSTVGKRLLEDPRGKLFQDYYRIIKEVKPKVFIYENVKGLLSMDKGNLINEIINLFKSEGYNVKYKVLDAANYGTPQHRKRVIIVGNSLNKSFEYPNPTHSERKTSKSLFIEKTLKPFVTIKDALSDLPLNSEISKISDDYLSPPKNDYQKKMREGLIKKIYDHIPPNNNSKLIQIMKALPQGGTPKDLPENLRPKSGFGNSYSRLWWDRPSPTITRNFSTPSSARCIHPLSPRPLTTREGARLQGFPDNYIFVGSRSEKNLQIGNAVPTLLSFAIKDSLKKLFNK